MKLNSGGPTVCLTCIAFVFLVAARLSTAAEGFDRTLEPVIVRGSDLQAFTKVGVGANDNELFLYAYRADAGLWEQIPFQIDEKDSSGSYFNPNGDETAGLDTNDVLVFMAKDVGDPNKISWLDDIDSQNSVRYEIKVFDRITQKSAYVYLYRSRTLTLTAEDYIVHTESNSANIGEDTIDSKYYHMRNGKNGFPQDISIPASAGGNGQDLLTALALKAKVSIVSIDEGDITALAVLTIDGLVRVIRQVRIKISIPLFPDPEIDIPIFHYPYSTSIMVVIPSIGVSLSEARLSFDLDEGLKNMKMKFISARNPEPGFTLDGVSDNPVKPLDVVLPDSNWIYINGTAGTIVNLFPIETTVGANRNLHYQDDDTNFGDTGIIVTDNISTPLALSYKGYYLDSGRGSEVGAQIAHFEKNPLATETIPQDFGAVPVELVTFTAEVSRDIVELAWTTATESNNFGFEVQRQKLPDGQWFEIGFVSGAGTTSEPISYEFADVGISPGDYAYRLRQIDTDGAFEFSPVLHVVVGLPETFALFQNYPNPFNPSTLIQYELAGASGSELQRTELTIYNLIGEKVHKLVDRQEGPGFYQVFWDGRNAAGLPVPSGVYLYQIRSGTFVDAKKMLLVR